METIEKLKLLLDSLSSRDNMETFSMFRADSEWLAHRSHYFSTFLKSPSQTDEFEDFVIFKFVDSSKPNQSILVSTGEGEDIGDLSIANLNEALDNYTHKKVVFDYGSLSNISSWGLSKKSENELKENKHYFAFNNLVSTYGAIRDSVTIRAEYQLSKLADESQVTSRQYQAHSIVHRFPIFYRTDYGYQMHFAPVTHNVTENDVSVSIPKLPFGYIVSEKSELSSHGIISGSGRDFNESYLNLADALIDVYGVCFDKWTWEK